MFDIDIYIYILYMEMSAESAWISFLPSYDVFIPKNGRSCSPGVEGLEGGTAEVPN